MSVQTYAYSTLNPALALPFKNRHACLKIFPFRQATKLQLPGHFWPAGNGLHTSVLGFWKNEHCFPYLKAASRELLCITATSAASERVFGVAAPISVTRSTFCQADKSSPEKSQILRQGTKKKANHFFQIYQQLQSRMKPVLSNLLNGNVPQSQFYLNSRTST